MKESISFEKKLLFDELMASLERNPYIFFSRFNRISVNDFGDLRRKIEKVSEKSMVVKNTLSRRAMEQKGMKDACNFLKGSILITLGCKEPQQISKVLVEFAKGNENFQLAGACLDGGVYPPAYVEQLAKLPSREVLIATVLNRLNAPVQNFVSVLGQLSRSLVIAIDQIQKKKAEQVSAK